MVLYFLIIIYSGWIM